MRFNVRTIKTVMRIVFATLNIQTVSITNNGCEQIYVNYVHVYQWDTHVIAGNPCESRPLGSNCGLDEGALQRRNSRYALALCTATDSLCTFHCYGFLAKGFSSSLSSTNKELKENNLLWEIRRRSQVINAGDLFNNKIKFRLNNNSRDHTS